MANTALPAITGSAFRDQMLTVSDGQWTGSPTSFARQWMRCDAAGANCVLIPSAVGSTYVLSTADVGSTVRVWTTAYSSAGASEAVVTAQTAVVATPTVGVPLLTSAPTITGTPTEGQVLTIGTGAWSNSPTSYGHCWVRCDSAGNNCVVIADGQDCTNATPNATHTLVAADVGKTIKAYTTAVNGSGNSSPTLSAATAVIAGSGIPPPPSTPARFLSDFEDGNYTEYADANGFAGWNLHRATVVASDGPMTPREGTKFLRLQLSTGDFAPWSSGTNAVGLKRQPQSADGLGQDVYLGWSICLRAGFPMSSWQIFMEWHGDNNFQAAFQQTIQTGASPKWRYNVNYLGTGNWQGTNTIPVEYDVWFDCVARMKWSKGSDGVMEVWMCKKGQNLSASKRVTYNGQTWYTSGQTSVALQPLYYRGAMSGTGVVLYDNIRVGNSFAAVTPR